MTPCTTQCLKFAMGAVLAGMFQVAATAANCDLLLQQHLQADLSLPFVEFDQDDTRGWRVLAAKGCEHEVPTLIQAYLVKQEKPHPVLVWHLAQSMAKAGRYQEAVVVARGTLRPQEAEDRSEFQWNHYVNGTIAFLESDGESLKRHRDRLESAAMAHPVNRLNFEALNRLQRCAGKPYKQAYSCNVVPER